jgi:hypothetical protein
MTLVLLSCQERNNREANIPGQQDSMIKKDSYTKTTDAQSVALEVNDVDPQVYRKESRIDTTLAVRAKAYQIAVRLLFDSTAAITVPEKYVAVWGLDSFTVFESYTRVTASKDDKILLDTLIRKANFLKDLDSPLIDYGNLFAPNVTLEKDYLEVGHSLSIPMTDIGVPVVSRFRLE